MSDDKFKIIREVKVGVLNERLRAEWDRLYALSNRLRRLQETHDTALDAFSEELRKEFGHHRAAQHAVTQDLSVSENGDVLLCSCDCPACQAVLHGMTVSETVEHMYENRLLSPQEVGTARLNARRLDAGLKVRKKMLN